MSEDIEIIFKGKFYKYNCDREVNPYDILIWLKDIKTIDGTLKQSISDGYISIIDNPHLKDVIGTLIYEQDIKFTCNIDYYNFCKFTGGKIMFKSVKII